MATSERRGSVVGASMFVDSRSCQTEVSSLSGSPGRTPDHPGANHACPSLNCLPADQMPRTGKRWTGVVGIVASVVALHLVILSFMFGPRQIGYALAAYFSAVFIWGLVFMFGGQRRVGFWIAGAVATMVMQQAAWFTMARQDFGFCWPLAQFASLHFLVGLAARAILNSGRGFVSGRW
jgi:hypothetical protein